MLGRSSSSSGPQMADSGRGRTRPGSGMLGGDGGQGEEVLVSRNRNGATWMAGSAVCSAVCLARAGRGRKREKGNRKPEDKIVGRVQER